MKDLPDRSPSDGSAAARLIRAAQAAQQLSDALWETLHEELRQPRPARVAELSARLADVTSTVAMLAAIAPPLSPSPPPAHGSDAIAPPVPPSPRGAHGSDAIAPPAPRLGVHGSDVAGGPASPPVERRTPPAPSLPEPPAAPQPMQPRSGEYAFTKLVDERDASSAQPLASVEPIQPEIEIRDVRREEGPSAWVSSVGQLLSRHAQDGLPFAVLLVEIVDVAQLERSETPHDLHGLVAKVESALGRGMRATDSLSRETLGRYWLVAPETNGTGARMLAERLARLVRTSASHRGIPMEVAIGIAVCPDDGTEAPALAARADLGVYSARATGRSIAHSDPPSAS